MGFDGMILGMYWRFAQQFLEVLGQVVISLGLTLTGSFCHSAETQGELAPASAGTKATAPPLDSCQQTDVQTLKTSQHCFEMHHHATLFLLSRKRVRTSKKGV